MRALFIILFYFLFDRELLNILHSEQLTYVFTAVSKVFSIIIIAILLLKHREKKMIAFFGYIFLPFFCMLLSTIINDGNIRTVFTVMYPIFSLAALIIWQCDTLYRTVYFVRCISILYFSLAVINFIFLILSPSYFVSNSGDMYFLGGENHIGYPLIKGLCFVLLDYYFTGNKIYLFTYLIVHITTILIVFSGSNMIGLFCMILFVIPNPLSRLIRNLSLCRLLMMFSGVFVFIILLGNLNVLLNTSLASYVIEGLLGKELTLSYRTIIWDMVIDGFFNSPFIGNGIRDTVNLFYISERYTTGYMSAHNQILQSLYECGILFFISLVPVVYNVSNKCQYAVPFVGNIFKATYCTILVMFMGEAPGMDKLLSMFIIGIGVSLKCDQYALESFRSGINIKR